MTASYILRVTFIILSLSWPTHFFFFFQKELSLKVEIFERKVESYKKLTPQLDNTIEYIKVRSSLWLEEDTGETTTTPPEAHINSLSPSPTQSQAGQAEVQIKAEFESLRVLLADLETSRLKALASEEEQKLSAVQQLIGKTNNDITGLKKLIESVTREMGNEDLALLQVKDR